MKTEDFNYELPEYLIAQTPLKDRDQSRLMVLDKASGKNARGHRTGAGGRHVSGADY